MAQKEMTQATLLGVNDEAFVWLRKHVVDPAMKRKIQDLMIAINEEHNLKNFRLGITHLTQFRLRDRTIVPHVLAFDYVVTDAPPELAIDFANQTGEQQYEYHERSFYMRADKLLNPLEFIPVELTNEGR